MVVQLHAPSSCIPHILIYVMIRFDTFDVLVNEATRTAEPVCPLALLSSRQSASRRHSTRRTISLLRRCVDSSVSCSTHQHCDGVHAGRQGVCSRRHDGGRRLHQRRLLSRRHAE